MKLLDELDFYKSKVEEHCQEFEMAKKLWATIIASISNPNT